MGALAEAWSCAKDWGWTAVFGAMTGDREAPDEDEEYVMLDRLCCGEEVLDSDSRDGVDWNVKGKCCPG